MPDDPESSHTPERHSETEAEPLHELTFGRAEFSCPQSEGQLEPPAGRFVAVALRKLPREMPGAQSKGRARTQGSRSLAFLFNGSSRPDARAVCLVAVDTRCLSVGHAE